MRATSIINTYVYVYVALARSAPHHFYKPSAASEYVPSAHQIRPHVCVFG